MVGKEIVSEKIVTMADVRKILENLEKKEELEYEQRITLDYSRNFSLVSPTDAKKMAKEINKAIDRLKDSHIATIINILPRNADEIRMLFAKDRYKLEEKEIKSVLSIVEKYAPIAK